MQGRLPWAVVVGWGMQDKRKEVRGGATDRLVRQFLGMPAVGRPWARGGISDAIRSSLYIMPGRLASLDAFFYKVH